MPRFVLSALALLLLIVVDASADSTNHRLGVNARVGATRPLNDDFISGTSETKAGLAAGGGLIYGFSEHVAGEVEVFHMPQLDVQANGAKSFDAAITDVSMGLQFRFLTARRLVPYLGFGPDFITGDLRHVNGTGYDLDWTFGAHVNLGLDWFVNPGVAITTDLRGVIAADGDVNHGGSKVSEYRPKWFQGTVGVRLMLPEKL